MKHRIATILLLILFLGSGCKSSSVESAIQNENVTLWVVTEETVWDGMNHQTNQRINQFKGAHKNVTVKFDILPTDEEERSIYLQKIRTQITAGKGPDVYMLPTGNLLTLNDSSVRIEPLFSDVTQVMYNGLFADVSSFYNEDEALNIDELNPVVMDAGVIDNARYILPLRYNIPVIYAHTEAIEGSGLNLNSISNSVVELIEMAIEVGSQEWCCRMVPSKLYYGSCLSYFSEAIDYEKQEVLITADEFVKVMEKLQDMKMIIDGGYQSTPWSIGTYIQGGPVWEDVYEPMFVGNISHLLPAVAISHALDLDLTMIPLRATDGCLVADVTYYAAVGASCDYPELAYEFVREFLTEEYQWEQNRPKATKATRNLNTNDGLIENSWPVRHDGAAEYLFEAYENYYSFYNSTTNGYQTRRKKILSTNVSEMTIPVLEVKLDRARFPIDIEWAISREIASGNVANVNLQDIADSIIQMLSWHVSEG